MAVRQRGHGIFGNGIRQRITFRQSAFGPFVFDRGSVIFIHRQVFNCRSPVVGGGQRYFSSVRQCHSQGFRTDPVLVVSVIPDFLYCRFGDRRCMAVRQDRLGADGICLCQRVTFRQSAFGPGIGDLLPVILILRQAFNGSGPVVFCGQRYFGPVGQRHGQGFRTDAVLVIRVIPDFQHRRRGDCRNVFIRHVQVIFAVAGFITIRYNGFFNRVNDLFTDLAGPVFIQSGEGVFPFGCRGDFSRTDDVTVSQQVDGESPRT